MADWKLNVKVWLRVVRFLIILTVPSIILSWDDGRTLGRALDTLGRLIGANPTSWFWAMAGGFVLALVLAYFLYERRGKTRVFTKRDWDKFYLDRALPAGPFFEKNRHRTLDAPGFRDALLRQSQLEPRERAELERWETARRKRVSEMTYRRMVDLPGYAQWSARYRKLDEIIPKLETYAFLVHPDELTRPLDAKFANEFQGWLNDAAERGRPRRTLEDYRIKRPVL